MAKSRSVLRAAAASLALFGASVVMPQAVAADRPAAQVASDADAVTRALARADPEAVAAAATVCGTGYTLSKGIPLPLGTDPSLRLATLFAYENGGKGCAIMDNNVGAARYMYLKVCKVDGTGCDPDSGNFTTYAGPVHVSSFACAPVTAKMGTSSSSLFIDYESEYVFPCG
uniref:Spore-associated protein A n=1 Tax=Streptomyces sp. NBC_01393 TaxID=2903851 RepID=A0AAU3I2P1_9ACTN